MIRKKLNNKGFTLVELLAVIIILAIVVGLTIPIVLTTTSNAKAKAFKTAADTVADWVDRQYQVYISGLEGSGVATVDTNFKSVCFPTTGDQCIGTSGVTTNDNDFITAAGLKTSNVSNINIKIVNNKACVTLTAVSGGDYVNSTGGDSEKGGAC